MFSRNANLSITFFGLDVLAIIAAVFLAGWVRLKMPFGIPLVELPWLFAFLFAALIAYLLIFLALSVYTPDRYYAPVEEFRLLGTACLVAGLALSGLVYFTIRETSRLYVFQFFLVHIGLVFGWRFLYFWLRRSQGHGLFHKTRVLLAGSGSAAKIALERLEQISDSDIQVIGYITDDGKALPGCENTLFLGNLNDAARLVSENKIDNLLIALPPSEYEKVEQLVNNLLESACSLWVVPDYYNLLIYGAHVRELGSLPMISLRSPTLTPNQRLFKRLFDIIAACLVLLILLPLLVCAAIAIKIESKGPIFFKQKRAGENGRLFDMYKFRSMVVDAEKHQQEVVRKDENGHIRHKTPDDPRVTKLGRFLRRSSIDELPQLINVLKGEMSMVGPRPEMPWLVALYEPWQRKRFAVPQGITGWWQVNGRSDKPMHLNIEYDLYYIQNYSLLLDLQIILRTPWAILMGKGAF